MKRAVILVFTIMLCYGLSGCGGKAEGAEMTSSPIPSDEAIVYKDGTYSGEGTGYGGKIPVEVTITDGEITNIVIGEHKEDAMYMDEAVKILDDIIAQQSTEVDAVTGATTSCVGIKSAVKKALAEAQK